MQIANTIIAAKQAGKWQSQRYYYPAAGGHAMDESTYKKLLHIVVEAEDELDALREQIFTVQNKLSNARLILAVIDPEERKPVDPMAMARAKKVLEQLNAGKGIVPLEGREDG